MPIKTILVHLDSTAACPARIRAAVDMAAAFRSQLTGLYAVTGSETGGAADREAAFSAAAEAAGVAAEWRRVVNSNDTNTSSSVTVAARYADLAILGQAGAEGKSANVPENLVDQVIAGAGRPVMVIPHVGTFPSPAQRAVVAWNGSRESARVVADALPLLARAERVTVVTLVSDRQQPPAADRQLAQIASYLAKHGIVAAANRLPIAAGQIDAAEALLSYLADQAADLLVIGSAGLSSRRAWAPKGLTEDILARMTAPVLVSY